MPFAASFRADAAGGTLFAAGDLDAASAGAFVDAVAARRPLEGLTIDTSELSFVDSAGLRAFLAVREMVATDAGARTRLRHVSSDLRRVLEICGLVDAFDEVD